MRVVFAAFTGLLAGVALLYVAALTLDAVVDHHFEDDFLAVYDCEATGQRFADCTRNGLGAHLHRLKPPPPEAKALPGNGGLVRSNTKP